VTGNPAIVSTTNCLSSPPPPGVTPGVPPCFVATGEGTWKWLVVYTNGTFHTNGTCGHESFVINNDPPCGATRTPTPTPTPP
jgi:hypothetical protein